MPEGITELWNKLKKYWSELEKDQKLRLYITAGVLLAAVSIVLFIGLRTEYVPLVAESDDYDIKAIVDYLDTTGVKYQKRDGQIYIDSRKKNDIEFDLTYNGVVSPGVKFTDTWAQLSLTATESDKQQLWKDYEQNSLVYKLKKFENVQDAAVQYTKPEKSIWARPGEDEEKGSAYVMLKKKEELSQKQVQGVVQVAAASLGIPAESITVVDENLNILNRNLMDQSMDIASTQEELRIQKREELEKSIYNHFGVGMVQYDNFDTLSVTVNPVLDFDKLVSEEKKYTAPDADGEGFINNQEILKEDLENGVAGAAPGIDSNPGTTTYQTGDTGNSTYSKSHLVEDRLYNEYSAQSEKALGKLIAEESSMTIALWYGRRVQDDTGLTNEFLDSIKTDAGRATGIPLNNISVSIYKVAPEVVPEVAWTETAQQIIDDYGFFVLMIVLLIALAIAAIPRRKPAEEEMEPVIAGAGPEFIVPEGEDGLPEIDMEEHNELRKQIEKFVQQKPDAVAQLLRNWLMEEWD